jgi:putative transposase
MWLWVFAMIETINKEILKLSMPKEWNMLVAKRFLSQIIEEYGKHPVSTDNGGSG